MTRLWSPGLKIRVDADSLGAPTAFRWRRRRHPVQQIDSRWRVEEGWWSTPVWREYFRLVTASGLWVVIYHDFVSGQWFLQRLYD